MDIRASPSLPACWNKIVSSSYFDTINAQIEHLPTYPSTRQGDGGALVRARHSPMKTEDRSRSRQIIRLQGLQASTCINIVADIERLTKQTRRDM
jgi:hypothetical protein